MRPAFAVAALLLAAPPALASRAAIDAALAKAAFSGVLVYGDGDAPAVVRSRGRTAAGRAHAATARWRWASVTKQLTATIAMQEVAAGHLALDAPVKTYWPDWPATYADAITIRMLLQHDSGLADPADDTQDKDGVPAFYRATGAAAAPDAEAAGYCAARPRAAPGSGFRYNNCDFIMLGALLERITGKPYATLVAERIAAPLGLSSIGLFAPDRPAAPHVLGLDHGRREPVVNLGVYGAAGSVYGTPIDLWRFDRALATHRLLDAGTTETMWAGDPKLGYAALGVWSYDASLKGCAAPTHLVERRGQIGGVQVRSFIIPATGAVLVAFTDRAELDFAEPWQKKGVSYDLLSAALCGGAA